MKAHHRVNLNHCGSLLWRNNRSLVRDPQAEESPESDPSNRNRRESMHVNERFR